MRTLLIIISFLLISPAHADDVIQQRNEIIRQQQELDYLREENEKQKRDFQHQSLEHQQDIQQLRNEQKALHEQQQQTLETQRIIDSWNAERAQKKAIKKNQDQEEYKRLKAENEQAAKHSAVVLDDGYYIQLANTLAGKGFTEDQINSIAEHHKSYVYRMIEKSAQGDADAQYKLSLIYAYGRGLKTDYDLASQLLLKAVKSGHVEAQAMLDKIHATNGQNQ